MPKFRYEDKKATHLSIVKTAFSSETFLINRTIGGFHLKKTAVEQCY